jgi:Ca-activated chloride channel family protein
MAVRILETGAAACAMFAAAAMLLAGCATTELSSPPVAQPPATQPPPPEARMEPKPAPVVAAPAPKPKPQAKAMPRNDVRHRMPDHLLGSAPYAFGSAIEAPLATYPGTDRFPDKEPSGIKLVQEQPVSTFSVDVDTASYAFVRRYLTSGRTPPREAVRVEEMVNYFPYAYPAPLDRTQPFRVIHALMPSPWSAQNQLLHIAIKGYDIARAERPRANVVLLVDTSGSMAPQDRLPLLQQGFRLFASQLRDDDRVAIVTYAGHAQVALEPTPGVEKQRILDVIDGLRAYGSTAGGDGIQRAYALAERHFDRNAVNRIILATDGDFNVGITDPRALERFVAGKRKSGIYLSVFGVGVGNLNDALMQRLAQAGNGNAAYIDSLLEARKAMSDELGSTMFPIADDVKVQVEFNPARVAAYRLIGYETRALKREDFKDDSVDAGDLGAGHAVTAIYEITPVGASQSLIDPLRYQSEAIGGAVPPESRPEEYAFVKLRYKLPGEPTSRLIEHAVGGSGIYRTLDEAPAEQRFAVAVAAFAQRLRGENAVESYDYKSIAALATSARGSDPEGYRAELVRLVQMAETLGLVAGGSLRSGSLIGQ